MKHTPVKLRSRAMGSEGAALFPDTGDIREDHKYIARVCGRDTVTDFANGERLALCWNTHDQMLEALKKARTCASISPSVMELVRAAIAAAEGGEK